jgi:nucleoside-diphosphate-sugar epimerase
VNPAPEKNSRGTCLVLGGRGFVGSAVAREAEIRGFKVTVVDKDNYDKSIGASVDLLINANGNSKKYLASQDPSQDFDLSVRSVLRSLHDFKAKSYVYLSTIDVYPDLSNPANNSEDAVIDEKSVSPYGFHKYLAEKIVRYYAPCWTIFRMGGFVGPGLWKNAIYDLLTGTPLKVHPDLACQHLHTYDLARLLFDVVKATPPRDIWNICGDGVVTVREVASWIPNAKLVTDVQGLTPEHYEVSVKKIRSVVSLPRTADTVKQFVQNVQSGKESIR